LFLGLILKEVTPGRGVNPYSAVESNPYEALASIESVYVFTIPPLGLDESETLLAPPNRT
jgi:hypothetical protein